MTTRYRHPRKYVQEIHVRPSPGSYGSGSGANFDNAVAGLENVNATPNSRVIVHGEHTTNPQSFQEVMETCFANGVTLEGADDKNEIGFPYTVLDFNGASGLQIRNLKFTQMRFRDYEIRGASSNPRPPEDRSKHVLLDHCEFYGIADTKLFEIHAGGDDWTFSRCLLDGLGASGAGVYTLNRPGEGGSGNRLTFEYCTIRNQGNATNVGDNHAIGIQASSDVLVRNCLLENCYGDIVAIFLAGNGEQKNIRIIDNVIKTAIRSNTTGRGIAVSADQSLTPVGSRVGMELTGNYIFGTEGRTISLNSLDPIKCEDNDIGQPTVADLPCLYAFINEPVVQNPINNRLWKTDDATFKDAVLINSASTGSVVQTLDPSNVIDDIANVPAEPTNVGVNG